MNQQQPQGMPPVNPNLPPQGNQMPAPMPQQMPQQGFVPPMQPMPGQQQNTGKKKSKKSKKKGSSNAGWVILGIFLMFAIAIGGGYLGYKTAINARLAEFSRKSKMAAAEQYQMALADIEQGKFANAKTRLDYVIEVDQNYPGAFDTLQIVQLALYPTASPTPLITATPAPTPTADTRGEEEMFRGIQQAMYSQNWEAAISQITALRDRNISYRGLEVDGMYYIALRNYGIQQINAGYLENGVYNITLAESFGPIDSSAENMRSAARAYLSGAGFWEINWSKALEYYSNAAQIFPNLYDRATMLTANQRFAEASFHVADEYVAAGDLYSAIPYYDQGLVISGSESVQQTATAVYLVVYPPQPTAAPQEESWSAADSGSEEWHEEEEFYIGD